MDWPNRPRAIIWADGGLVYWRICTPRGLGELIFLLQYFDFVLAHRGLNEMAPVSQTTFSSVNSICSFLKTKLRILIEIHLLILRVQLIIWFNDDFQYEV